MEFTEFEHNNNWKIKKFPCSCCLVKPICSDYKSCELLEKNIKKIFNLIKDGKCPDCGSNINKITADYCDVKCNNCEHIFIIFDKFKFADRGSHK